MKVRVGDVPIGIVDDLIKVLIRSGIRACLRRDVLTTAEKGLERGILLGVARCPLAGIGDRIVLLLRKAGVQLALVRLIGLRILGVGLPNELLVVVFKPRRELRLSGRGGVLWCAAAAHYLTS